MPQSDVTCRIGESPACCPEKVHVIFVDSPFDVLRLGKLERVAESLKESGCQIEVFNYHRHGNDICLTNRIREVRTNQPTGRIVVIGYSSGALMFERALTVLETEQVCVDAAINLDSNILSLRSDEASAKCRSHAAYLSPTC